MKFHVLFRNPQNDTDGFFTEVEAADSAQAIWQVGQTVNASAAPVLVAVYPMNVPHMQEPIPGF